MYFTDTRRGVFYTLRSDGANGSWGGACKLCIDKLMQPNLNVLFYFPTEWERELTQNQNQ